MAQKFVHTQGAKNLTKIKLAGSFCVKILCMKKLESFEYSQPVKDRKLLESFQHSPNTVHFTGSQTRTLLCGGKVLLSRQTHESNSKLSTITPEMQQNLCRSFQLNSNQCMFSVRLLNSNCPHMDDHAGIGKSSKSSKLWKSR